MLTKLSLSAALFACSAMASAIVVSPNEFQVPPSEPSQLESQSVPGQLLEPAAAGGFQPLPESREPSIAPFAIANAVVGAPVFVAPSPTPIAPPPIIQAEPVPVSEPSSLLLVLLGVWGLAIRRVMLRR